MSSTKNLMGEDAIEKLRDLVDNSQTCMFASGLGDVPPHLCPMQAQQVDDEGNLWFFSGADSVHNRQIQEDPRTQLIFCNPAKLEYLAIFSETTITKDPAKVDELWSQVVEAWFPGGKDDPNLTLLRVRPTMAHYWDTEDGKLIAYAKMLTAAMTGTRSDAGVEGDIDVS